MHLPSAGQIRDLLRQNVRQFNIEHLAERQQRDQLRVHGRAGFGVDNRRLLPCVVQYLEISKRVVGRALLLFTQETDVARCRVTKAFLQPRCASLAVVVR